MQESLDNPHRLDTLGGPVAAVGAIAMRSSLSAFWGSRRHSTWVSGAI